MSIIILHNGAQVNVRQAPRRLAADVMRRIAKPAPDERVAYAQWCEQILRPVERYISVSIDAGGLAQARELFASLAEQGYQEPPGNEMRYLIWCVLQDESRTDLGRIVDPIVAPSAKTGLQQRLDQRRR